MIVDNNVIQEIEDKMRSFVTGQILMGYSCDFSHYKNGSQPEMIMAIYRWDWKFIRVIYQNGAENFRIHFNYDDGIDDELKNKIYEYTEKCSRNINFDNSIDFYNLESFNEFFDNIIVPFTNF